MNECVPLCFIQLRTSSSSVPLRPALSCPPLPFAVLCCAVLCCAVLCCAVLCCAVLCFAVLCGTVLCCATVFCLFSHCPVPFCLSYPVSSSYSFLSCSAFLSYVFTCTLHLSRFVFHTPLHSTPLLLTLLLTALFNLVKPCKLNSLGTVRTL